MIIKIDRPIFLVIHEFSLDCAFWGSFFMHVWILLLLSLSSSLLLSLLFVVVPLLSLRVKPTPSLAQPLLCAEACVKVPTIRPSGRQETTKCLP